MPLQNSVTGWFHELQQGKSQAAQGLWEAYFSRLVGLARRRLEGTARKMADEEDVALSAFKSFCLGAQNGRFDNIEDRDSLWRLLVVITARKAADLAAYQKMQKRDVARVQEGGKDDDAMIDRMVGQEPTPEFAALIGEEFRLKLESLESNSLRQIALLKMEGYSNEEIAEQQQCSLTTVKRRLRMIRQTWNDDESK